VELSRRDWKPEGLAGAADPPQLRSADTSEFAAAPFSVTEQTTKHLDRSGEKQ